MATFYILIHGEHCEASTNAGVFDTLEEALLALDIAKYELMKEVPTIKSWDRREDMEPYGDLIHVYWSNGGYDYIGIQPIEKGKLFVWGKEVV